jgi:DNA replication and repair protein RecF
MHLTHLHLLNFKNYTDISFSFSERLNGLVGDNGSGKTNVLDAIYYLSMCKSYLNTMDRQNIRFGELYFAIQGNWKDNEAVSTVNCAVKMGSKKIVKRNKKEYERLADHIGQYPVVFISPYDGDLIAEGSELRRKWMDGILVQIDREYLEQLQFYAKILDQRNALLKSMFEHRLFDRESMEVWDIQLITAGELIHKKRQQFLEEFIPVFQKCYKEIGGNKEEVGLSYRSQLNDGSFIDLLKASEKRDAFSQYTNVGIHKDDLLFTINEHPAKKFGSQGQQKSFVIALRLAQYDWLKNHLAISPVLLLDDVFDKLDGKRVQKLIQMVTSLDFGQVIVTDTDIERMRKLFEGLNVPSRIFEVKNQEVEIIHEIEFHESER